MLRIILLYALMLIGLGAGPVGASQAGIDWQIVNHGFDNSWRSVTYGAGLFVAVANTGTGNRVMTSPDGITWTARTNYAADNSWGSVTYGAGLFVAVATSGVGNRVMISRITAQTITVDQAAPADAANGSTFTVKAHADSGLGVSVIAAGVCSGSGVSSGTPGSAVTVTMTGSSGACTVAYNQSGDTNYSSAPQVTSSTAATAATVKADQSIMVTTSAPGGAAYGATFTVTAYSTSALAVTYSSGSPTICSSSGADFTMISSAGNCKVQYDQSGNDNFNPATQVVETTAAQKAVPGVTSWPTASAITYGQTLASSTLSGGASTPTGSFTFTTPTTAPSAGTASQGVTFTPTDRANYTTVTGTVSVTVNKATSGVTTWPTASAITYGQTLASSTLSGGVDTPAGSFAFTTPTTAPSAGTASQGVTFTPTDTSNYTTVTGTASVTVNKATSGVTTWPTASAITYGQTLASSTLSGGSSTPAGSFAFITPTTAPATGVASQGVTFTPTDTSNYTTVTGTVSVTVNKATSGVTTWPTASAVTYGQTLASSTLSGGASGPAGSFTFTTPTTAPATGVASQGVTFTPTDTSNYTTVTGTVSVTVNKATSGVTTWPTASAITYGQTLASSTLSGGASTPTGSFAFTTPTTAPAAGTVSLGVTFTPTDTSNYTTVTGTASVTVNKATSGVTTWPTASGIAYGQTLASSTLSGGAATPTGSFAFTTPTTTPNAGTAVQNVTFTPTDSANYATAVGHLSVTVAKADPGAISWPTAGSVTYGRTLASSTLSGGSSTPVGSFAWTTPGTTPGYGTAPYGVTFTPIDTINYLSKVSTVSLTVAKGNPTVTVWPTASGVTYGQTLVSSALSGGSSTPGGSFAWTASGTMPTIGTAPYAVTFTPTDGTKYSTVAGTTGVTVSKAGQAVSFGALSAKSLSDDPFGVTADASVTPVSFSSQTPAVCTVSGTLVTLVQIGTCTIRATQGGDGNYTAATPVDQSFAVTVGSLDHLSFSAISGPKTAGADFSVTITAQDKGNNTVTSFTGAVNLSTTAGTVAPTATGAFTAGVWTGNVNVTLAGGGRTITATETGGKTGTSGAFDLVAGAATAFSITAPSSRTAGTTFDITVTAKDSNNNRATTYTGTVAFTSSDLNSGIVLPENYLFVIGDNGGRTFTGVTLETAGDRTVTATDTVTPAIVGTSNTVAVSHAGATTLLVTAPASATAGTDIGAVTVTAQDSYGNTVTDYTGTVQFTSSNPGATVPGNVTLAGGSVTVTSGFILTMAGTQTITATDTVTPSIHDVSGSIAVGAGSPSKLAFSVQPSNSSAGGTIMPAIVVQIQDTYGNLTGATDTIALAISANPASGVLSGSNSLSAVAGKAAFSTLKIDNAGTGYTLLATSGLLTATSATFNITSSGQTITVTADSPATAASGETFTVAATATGGTVTYGSAGGCTNVGDTFTMTSGTTACTVLFDQSGDATYSAAPQVSRTVTATKASSTTTVTVSDVPYDGGRHGATATATGAGGLSQSVSATYAGRNGTIYSSSSTAPANAGEYTATAAYAGDSNHDGSADSKNYSITKATSTTTVSAGGATYDGSQHGGTAAVIGAGGLSQSVAVSYVGKPGTTYLSSATAPANAGDYTATATFAGDSNHSTSSGSTDYSIATAATTTTVTVSDAAYNGSQQGGTATVTGAGGLSQSVTVLYSGRVTTVYASSGAAPTSVGDYTATATFAGDGNHTAGNSDSKNYSITMGTQAVITVTGPLSVTYGATGVATATGGNCGGSYIFSHGSSTGCSVSGSTLSVSSAIGACTLTASCNGDSNYNASATSAGFTVTLNKADPIISIVVVDATIKVGAATGITASSAGPGSFTYTPSSTVNCITSGSTVTGLNAGTCTVTANQAASDNYNAGTATQSFTVVQGNQTITFGPTPNVTVGRTGLLTATNSSGLTVTYGSSTTNVCTLSGVTNSTVTGVNAGTCSITATQAGNGNFNAASTSLDFTIGQASQTITFGAAPSGVITGSAPFTVSATATSGSAVTFSADTTGVCTLGGTNNGTVTPVAAGICVVKANQPGNGNYAAAQQVVQHIAIGSPAAVTVVIQTNPPGLEFTLNGGLVTAPYSFTTTPATSYTVNVPTATQNGGAGTRYVFNNWSDGGGVSHIIATSGSGTYTANFTTQYQLTVTDTDNHGTVSPALAWFNAGANATIYATPEYGYIFSSWSLTSGVGPITNSSTATTPVVMNGPNSVNAAMQMLTPANLKAGVVAGGKTGNIGGVRVWPIQIQNTGASAATTVKLNSVTFSTIGLCKPTVTAGTLLPLAYNSIGSGSTGIQNIQVNFAGCAALAKVNVTIRYTADGGISGSNVITSQLQ